MSPAIKPPLVLPKVDTINSRPVEWVVLTSENFEQKIAELGDDVVLFAVTAEGYENIALNLNDIRKLVEQQQAVIFAYKRYYE